MANGYVKLLRENALTSYDEIKLSDVYTASDVLTKVKTVDGAGSGLDADLLDGTHLADIIATKVTQNAHGFAVGNAVGLSGST
jgi:hypothetical protein